ncbi:MAG: hypothetical protein U5J83_00550 [Bryobacterales bacterium]|nr:hypothetical protein [Bryobacterales bacterium]
MAIAQQQHGFPLDFIGGDVLALGQRGGRPVLRPQGLVVQRRDGQVGVGEGLGEDGAIDFPQPELLQQLDR